MLKQPPLVITGTESPRFDLTSATGLATVAAFLLRTAAPLTLASPAAPIAIPIVALLAYYELQKVRRKAGTVAKPNTPRSALSSSSVREDQRAVAVAILEKGRELGLSEVEIVLEQEGGVNVGARLPKALNVDLRLKAGRSTKTTVRAKYRVA